MNSLPFRLKLAGGRWIDLAQQIFNIEQEQLSFRWYPVVQQWKQRERRALFEVQFSFTRFHVYESLAELYDLQILAKNIHGKNNFVLTAAFHQDITTSDVHLGLMCDTRELSNEQRDMIADCYLRAITAITQDPFARYETHPLISLQDTQRQLIMWNMTDKRYPHHWSKPTLRAHYQIILVTSQVS